MSTDAETDIQFADFSKFKRTDFETQLNTEFSADLNYLGMARDGSPQRQSGEYPTDVNVELKLVEVTPRDAVSPDFRQDPFVLLFQGSHETPLYSNVHVLTHASLGTFSVLLTTVNAFPGKQSDGIFYEAVVG